MTILEMSNDIVFNRGEEKDRQYGDFKQSMDYMRDIFNAMTGLNLTTQHMYKAMIAAKFARERHAHKHDNLLDAIGYIASLDDYENHNPKQS